MTKRDRLLRLLGDRFGDDPKAIKAIHEAIADHYKKGLEEAKSEHRQEIDNMRSEHKTELSRRDRESKMRHQEALQAIREAREYSISAAESKVKESEGRSGETVKTSFERIERKLKKYDTQLDTNARRIERFSEFAVGAPNRSIYINGAIISGRYSDVNLIPGSGITITEVDNETTHQADTTFTATGGAGIAVLVPAGTVNGINTSFVFVSAPSVIVLDNGNVMNKVSSDGTVNWTGTTNVILNQAPNFNIYGI